MLVPAYTRTVTVEESVPVIAVIPANAGVVSTVRLPAGGVVSVGAGGWISMPVPAA